MSLVLTLYALKRKMENLAAPVLETGPGMHLGFHSNVLFFMLLHAWLEAGGLLETDSTMRRTTTYAMTADILALLYNVGELAYSKAKKETNSKYRDMQKHLDQQRLKDQKLSLIDKTRAELSHALAFVESDIPTFLTTSGVLSITTGLLSSLFNNYYPLSSLGIFGGNFCFALAKAELAKACALLPEAENKLANGIDEPIKTNGVNGHKPSI